MKKIAFAKYIGLLVYLVTLSACTAVVAPMNQPIKETDSGAWRQQTQKRINEHNNSFVVLTFSGGGTRAAAFAYGVLKGLRDTPISIDGQQHNLLDEVDVISSVSGGSFTAAYYGLFGDKIFRDYENVFLRHPIQSELIGDWLLSPANWGKLGSVVFNRTDLAAEYYNKQVFQGKTFADMRQDMPLIVINSTDISAGNVFSFTPMDMRWICTDWGSYPVSRAVAASSAVPGLFSSITLKNFSGCNPDRLGQLGQETPTINTASYRINQALGMRQYLDKTRYPFLHLVDGGVADNLGVRSLLRMVELQGDDFLRFLQAYRLKGVDNVVFIVVNAATDIPPHIAQSAEDPSLEDTISASTTIQSTRYNVDTLDLLTEKSKQWQAQSTQKKCEKYQKKHCQPVRFYTIELNLKQLPKTMADKASLYETALELPEEQVSTLIYAGRYALKHSANYLRLLKDLNASAKK